MPVFFSGHMLRFASIDSSTWYVQVLRSTLIARAVGPCCCVRLAQTTAERAGTSLWNRTRIYTWLTSVSYMLVSRTYLVSGRLCPELKRIYMHINIEYERLHVADKRICIIHARITYEYIPGIWTTLSRIKKDICILILNTKGLYISGQRAVPGIYQRT